MNALFRLAAKSAQDPMALLRMFAKQSESGVTIRVETTGQPDLDSFCLALVRAKRQEVKGHIDKLLARIDLAIKFRRLQNETAYTRASAFIKQHNGLHLVREGNRILALAYAISPRNMFGIVIIALMDLTTTAIGAAKSDDLAALIVLLVTSLAPGSVNRGVPSGFAPAIDVIVERILPHLE